MDEISSCASADGGLLPVGVCRACAAALRLAHTSMRRASSNKPWRLIAQEILAPQSYAGPHTPTPTNKQQRVSKGETDPIG
eukprot:3920419-Rhodomonas_salina.1